MRQAWSFFFAIMLVAGMWCAPTNAGVITYHFTDLGPGLGGYANGVSSSGAVVGEFSPSSDPAVFHGFIYNNGVLTDLGKPFGSNTFLSGINNLGQIAGQGNEVSGTEHGFIYTNGNVTDLRPLGIYTANAINSVGQVAGTSIGNGTQIHAAFYSNGTATDLGTINGGATDWSEGLGINDGSEVVGYSQTGAKDANLNLITHPFAWTSGPIQDLGTFGGTSSRAIGINSAGQIVGFSDTTTRDVHGNGGSSHAFLYSSGVLKDLSPGFGSSGANAINSSGQIVGWVLGNNAALYNTSGFVGPLAAMTPDLPSGWVMQNATGINDNGWITGYGLDTSGHTHGFLLTPTPEPSLGGILGIFVLMGRRGIFGNGRGRRGRRSGG